MYNFSDYLFQSLLSVLNMIFWGLLGGQLIYFIFALFLIQSGNMPLLDGLGTMFLFIVPIAVVFSIFASKMIYTKLVAAFDKNKPIEEKLVSYRTNNIVKLSVIEGANIFTISVMIITSDYLYSAFFALLIAFFWLNKPSTEKFKLDYAF